MDHHRVVLGMMAGWVALVCGTDLQAGITSSIADDGSISDSLPREVVYPAVPTTLPGFPTTAPNDISTELVAPTQTASGRMDSAVAIHEPTDLEPSHVHEIFFGAWADRVTISTVHHVEIWDDAPRAAMSAGADPVVLGSEDFIDEAPRGAIVPLPTPALTGVTTLVGIGVLSWAKSRLSHRRSV